MTDKINNFDKNIEIKKNYQIKSESKSKIDLIKSDKEINLEHQISTKFKEPKVIVLNLLSKK